MQHIILHKAVIKRKFSIDVNIEEWITFCSVKHDFATINDIEMSFFLCERRIGPHKYVFINEIFFVITRKLTPIDDIKIFFMDDPIRRSYFTHV